MRTFIAIEIPAEVKQALARLQEELRDAPAEVSWTKPENIHLTLKFLGEVEESMLGRVEAAAVEAAAGARPFTLALGGVGAFPNARQPRIIWAGLSGEVEAAARLQVRLDERLAALGFPKEDRPFRPHLTVGRVKSPTGAPALIARAQSYRLPSHSLAVRELVVMRSQLHPAGSRYTPLARIALEQVEAEGENSEPRAGR